MKGYMAQPRYGAALEVIVARNSVTRGGERLQGLVDYSVESSDVHIHGCLQALNPRRFN